MWQPSSSTDVGALTCSLLFCLKTQDVQKAMDERRFKDAVQLRGR